DPVRNGAGPAGDAATRDLEAEEEMDIVMQTVVSLRTLRSELRVPPSKEAEAALVTDDECIRNVVVTSADLIKSLSGTNLTETAPGTKGTGTDRSEGEKPKTAVAIIPGGKCLVPLEGLIDIELERGRLAAVISRKEQELSRSAGKLENEGFTARAPADVVEKERRRAEELARELGEIQEQYERYFGA
ncbi:MAG: hypothetical protein AAB281_02865, partial [Actinomycetota bacterium]